MGFSNYRQDLAHLGLQSGEVIQLFAFSGPFSSQDSHSYSSNGKSRILKIIKFNAKNVIEDSSVTIRSSEANSRSLTNNHSVLQHQQDKELSVMIVDRNAKLNTIYK